MAQRRTTVPTTVGADEIVDAHAGGRSRGAARRSRLGESGEGRAAGSTPRPCATRPDPVVPPSDGGAPTTRPPGRAGRRTSPAPPRPTAGQRVGHPGVELPGALAFLRVQRRARTGRRRGRPGTGQLRPRGIAAYVPRRRDRAPSARPASRTGGRRPGWSGDIQPSSLRVPSGKSSRLQPRASRSAARLRSRREPCRSTGNALKTSAVTAARTRASKK